MQTGPDLVSAGYPTSNPLAALLGQTTNATQPDLPARSNLYFGTILGTLSDAAIGTTGQGLAVAVPALPGDVISKVTVLAGATAEASGTHGYLAVYSGIAVPKILNQTPDITGAAAVSASTLYSGTLGSAITLDTTSAPNGFVYVSISFTASTIPTLVSSTVPTACQTPWASTAPLFLGATHGSGLGGNAPATIASPTAAAKVPIVVLT